MHVCVCTSMIMIIYSTCFHVPQKEAVEQDDQPISVIRGQLILRK